MFFIIKNYSPGSTQRNRPKLGRLCTVLPSAQPCLPILQRWTQALSVPLFQGCPSLSRPLWPLADLSEDLHVYSHVCIFPRSPLDSPSSPRTPWFLNFRSTYSTTHLELNVCVFACVCMYVYKFIYIYVCVCIYTCVYKYIHMHI